MKVPSPFAVGKVLNSPPACLRLQSWRSIIVIKALFPSFLETFHVSASRKEGEVPMRKAKFSRAARACAHPQLTPLRYFLAWNIIPCGSCKLDIIWWHYTDYKHPSSVPLCSVPVPPYMTIPGYGPVFNVRCASARCKKHGPVVCWQKGRPNRKPKHVSRTRRTLQV